MFSFRTVVDLVQQAAVLSNVQVRLVLSDVLNAVCFNLGIRIDYPLLRQRTSNQCVVKVASYGHDAAVKLALSRFL